MRAGRRMAQNGTRRWLHALWLVALAAITVPLQLSGLQASAASPNPDAIVRQSLAAMKAATSAHAMATVDSLEPGASRTGPKTHIEFRESGQCEGRLTAQSPSRVAFLFHVKSTISLGGAGAAISRDAHYLEVLTSQGLR